MKWISSERGYFRESVAGENWYNGFWRIYHGGELERCSGCKPLFLRKARTEV